MTTIADRDTQLVKEVDAGVKNQWKFGWLEKTTDIQQGETKINVRIGDCFDKIKTVGQARCKVCSKVINYGSRGMISLIEHIKSAKHVKLQFESRQSYKVDSMFKQYAGEPQASNSPSTSSVPSGNFPVHNPMCDRISNAEATTLAVVTEHGMPLSYVPTIINLAKTLAKDQKALSEVKLDRTAAAYKTKYGLAEGFRQKLISKLRKCSFSLNLDEATSSNKKKVLTMLVSFYDSETNDVKIEHLDSVEIRKTDSESVFQEIVKAIEGNDISWKNLVSVLMDSCGVMRGNKNGVETRLRREKAPHLLDVDGDSCHHIHNSSKKLCEPFARYLESLFNDLHADFQYCSEYAQFLEEICGMISIKYSKPARFIPHRWLSAYDISLQTTMLYDAYVIFYYPFLSNEDKKTYKEVTEKIFADRGVSADGVKKLQAKISAKKMTDDGKQRKKRICLKILMTDITTKLQLSFYTSVMQILKQYVLLFQSADTLVHQLHEQQFKTFKEFLACFMKAEHLVTLTPKTAKTMTFGNPEEVLHPMSMYIGSAAEEIIMKLNKKDSNVRTFLSQAQDAFIQCAAQMQKTLPLNNRTLKSLAAIDPALANHSQGTKMLKRLALEDFQHLLNEGEEEGVRKELLQYSTDNTISDVNNNVVEWWARVQAKGSYPLLCKVATACLSIFHGPAVESSFNCLGDIVDSKAASMEVETYSAYQTVRYALKARHTTAMAYFSKKDVNQNAQIDKHMCVQMRMAAQRYKRVQAEKREKKGKKLKSVKSVKEQIQNVSKMDYDNHVEAEMARAKKRVMKEKLLALAKKRKISG